MKISKVMLNIESVVCFLFGALYVFSLVFIPVGVYCFLAGKRFSYKAEHLDDDMFLSKQEFKAYVIFASIACFPFGLLSIIPYIILTGNNVKVTNTQGLHLQKDEESVDENVKVKDALNEDDLKETKEEPKQAVVQKDDELSEEEKLEKFKKLESFKEKGIITEQELELAREQLFGKKD